MLTKMVRNLKTHWYDTYWWKYEILLCLISLLFYRKNEGIYILKEKWDNLIILDACRYDIFKEINNIEGKLQYRISRGSHTSEWIRENFVNVSCNDIVYIASNPLIKRLAPQSFFKIINVWDFGWDENLRIVPPSAVYKCAVKAIKEYPRKRLIIHFSQPHLPFLDFPIYKFLGLETKTELKNASKKDFGKVLGEMARKGGLPKQQYIQGHRRNLKIVLTYVKKLLKELSGKTVITSDHGETFGEFLHPLVPLKVYTHPEGIRIKSLIKVPWFIAK